MQLSWGCPSGHYVAQQWVVHRLFLVRSWSSVVVQVFRVPSSLNTVDHAWCLTSLVAGDAGVWNSGWWFAGWLQGSP